MNMKENEQCIRVPEIDPVNMCKGCIFERRKIWERVSAAGNTGCTDWDCAGTIVVLREKPAAARSTDPETSHAAASSVTPKRASIKDHILIELAVHGGCTGTEIAERTRTRLNSITPRFKELADANKIKDSGKRRDRQIVWVTA